MAKIVKLNPINQKISIQTNDNLLSGFLKNELNILQKCRGRGFCATCHVYVKEGIESLSPMNRRERKTLESITTCNQYSRLACQARVMDEGIVVELPSGTYVNQIDDLEALIGQRAQQDILHPLSGTVVVEAGKLITRSIIGQLQATQGQVDEYLTRSQDA